MTDFHPTPANSRAEDGRRLWRQDRPFRLDRSERSVWGKTEACLRRLSARLPGVGSESKCPASSPAEETVSKSRSAATRRGGFHQIERAVLGPRGPARRANVNHPVGPPYKRQSFAVRC